MLRFDEIKSSTLNLRVSPLFKRAIKLIAERENRSVANSLEWLVMDYFERNGLTEADVPKVAKKKMSEVASARR